MNRLLKLLASLLLLTLLLGSPRSTTSWGGASAQQPEPYQPPRHALEPPSLGASRAEVAAAAELGVQVERDRGPVHALTEHRRLAKALAGLQPQRRGLVDAYVLSVALDSDPVFGREAREAGRVLSRRYRADGRTIVLAGSDGARPSELPMGSPQTLAAALARIAELMDPREDVLVLYVTTHGAPLGMAYHDADQGYGLLGPARLWRSLRELGIERRLLLVSACYSGVYVPMMMGTETAIVTASAADRTSFGCQADSDWTFFGDALINQALRKPQPLARAVGEARGLIAGWERRGELEPSNPQASIGPGAARWLAQLERDLPSGTSPVGRPAVTQLEGP